MIRCTYNHPSQIYSSLIYKTFQLFLQNFGHLDKENVARWYAKMLNLIDLDLVLSIYYQSPF